MRLLLDAHILLWCLSDDPKLPQSARTLVSDETNAVYYSVAAAWEVAIKHAVRPKSMLADAAQIISFCEEAGYLDLPIASRHVKALETLQRPADAPAHNDPFDRIMIAQAKADDLIFLSHDARIAEYEESCIFPV